NYFFPLSKYQEPLLELYAQHPEFVLPETRRNEVVSFVQGGLQDLSVSRAAGVWGIPVPWDPKHVVYVWVDALLNYITADGFGADAYRWYFVRDVQFGQDGDFTWESLRARYTSELANGLGNLASRVLAMVDSNFDGMVPEPSTPAGTGGLSKVAGEAAATF